MRGRWSAAESAARLGAVVETAVDGIITIGVDGIIDTINPAACRMFGYTAEELIGHPVEILMPEPHRSHHSGYLERYLSSGHAHIIGIGRELKALHKDGTCFPIDLAVGETRVADRLIFTGIIRDLSERERVRQALSEEQRFAAAILETVGALVVVIDAEGSIVRFNRASEQTTGYREGEVLGMPLGRLIPAAQRADVERAWATTPVNGSAHEHSLVDKHGKQRLISWRTTTLVGADPRRHHVIGTGLDITDARAAEAATSDISERERRRLGQELHDGCGQHLTAMTLLVRMLQDDLRDHELPAAVAAAGRIRGIAQELITDMRRISRGLYPIELERFGLAAALHDLATTHPATVDCACYGFADDEDRSLLAPSVALHLFRIAQEAVNNATAHAVAQSIRITLRRNDQGVELSVADDGRGIVVEETGSGMGLLSMEHRAKSMGARLEITSRKRGTRVRCLVPAGQAFVG